MDEAKYITIGRIIKIHGFDGTVIVRTESNFSGRIKESEPVFLIIEGKPVPFFLLSAEQPRQGTLLLRFDGYDSPASIKEFAGCMIAVRKEQDNTPVFQDSGDLTGYMLFSSEGIEIGRVTEVISNPGQYLLKIHNIDNKEILIPLHEDLLLEINTSSKSLRMNLPEGLTEINS